MDKLISIHILELDDDGPGTRVNFLIDGSANAIDQECEITEHVVNWCSSQGLSYDDYCWLYPEELIADHSESIPEWGDEWIRGWKKE